MSTRGRRGLLWLLAGGALALLAGRWVAGLYADHAFHVALGTEALWRTATLHTLAVAALAFAGSATFAFANLYAVRQSIVSLVLPQRLLDLEFAEAIPTGRLTAVAAVLSLLIGIVFALLPHDWRLAAMAWDGVTFQEIEPYLRRDLGFYVAWLPWERAVFARSVLLFAAVSAIVAVLYVSTPSVRWNAQGLYLSTWVRRHLAVLAGVGVLLVGWSWRLQRFDLLVEGSGRIGPEITRAFTAFDHLVMLPYLTVASVATVPVAVVLIWSLWSDQRRAALVLLSLLVFGGPLAKVTLPLFGRGDSTTPNERRRERPYEATSALYTRRAFAVEEIARADTSDVVRVPVSALATSVSAWDPVAAARAVRFDRRRARDSHIAFAARGPSLGFLELSPSGDDANGTAWTADRFDAPLADPEGGLAISTVVGPTTIPRVLVHPDAPRFALVHDPPGRLAAPAFVSALNRVMLSWDLQNPGLLFRDPPYPRPRLMTVRAVEERVRRAAPFLVPGPTIAPLVRGDSLYWFVELFVTSSDNPLSRELQPFGRPVRYARHAATAVVQAQTGDVRLVPVERPDAVMRAWMHRLPSLFTPLAAMPDWYRHERPPVVDALIIQGAALSHVGFAGDTLGLGRITRADDAHADLANGDPAHFQIDSTGALGWGAAMDIQSLGRTLGVLVARGGERRRTEYLPAPGPRWESVLEGLQDAAERAGFARATSTVQRGKVQAIPTDVGVAYVQSYYDWPSDGAPRLLGVATSIGGRARAGRTLAEALGGASPTTRPMTDAAFRARASALYQRMDAALRTGDWTAYGRAWAELGALIGRPR